MITHFDKQNLKAIRADIDAALKQVAEKHGLQSIVLGNIRFTHNSFSAKLDALTTQGAATQNASNQFSGYPPIGSKRRQGYSVFEVTSIESSRPKYPISVVNQNGTRYKLSVEQWSAMQPA